MRNSTNLPLTKLFFIFCFVFTLTNVVWAQEANFINSPSSVTVESNEEFSIVVQVQTDGAAIDGAEAHLNFDPSILQVTNVTVLTTELPVPIETNFDNSLGQIDYTRGTFSNFPTTDFDFIEIGFQAIGTGNTTIIYNSVFPRQTKITSNFNNILDTANDIPVEITAEKEDPIASFTATPTSGTAALLVSVDASASLDPDGGNIVSYDWNFGDTNTATGITADNNYTVPNTYTITLIVTDDEGATSTATQIITVNGITIPTYTVTASAGPNGSIDPVSATVDEGGSQIFTFTPDSGYEVADVLVDGNSVGAFPSYELVNVQADTNISVAFSLINVDSEPEITLDATATVDEGGNLSVPLLITDADGDALVVTVTSVSNEPQELQSGNNNAQTDPYPFDASGFLTENITTDLGGLYSSNLVFAPNFGDGGSNGDGSGVYTITVSVTDADDNTIVETLDVTVNDIHQSISENGVTRLEAESYDNQGPANAGSGNNGIGVEDNTPAGGVVNIGFTTNGDFAEYLIDVETAGTYSFDFFVAKASGSVGTMTVNGGPASISVSSNGNWQQYNAVNATVALPAGQQTLRFDWSGPNGFYFNMDYFDVTFLGGINDAPTIDSIADVEVDETDTVSVNVQVNDDGNSPLAVSIEILDKSVPGGTNNPFTPAATISGYTFTDNGSGSFTLSWDTGNTDGRSYEARVTADDGVNAAVIETFTIDVAQDIPDTIFARTFSSPLPWYGANPQAPDFTVSIEGAGNIGYIDNNDFVEYLIDVPAAGDYNLRINAAKGNGNSGLLTVSEENGGSFSPVGTVTVAQTGWTNYNNYSTSVTFTNPGLQTLRFDFSGGMNISEFQFTPFTTNSPPIVDIITPTDGLTVEQDIAINFTATAVDTQDGDVAASLVWNSDIDGDFGTGANVNTSGLSTGTHTITATATDTDPVTPLTGSASITVSIYQTAPACDVRFRVNAGGALFANSTGNFEEDQATATVGGTAQTGTPSQYVILTAPAVDKTFGSNVALTSNETGYPDFLFQTERYSDAANPNNMNWAFPTENGIYDVKILFNENWTGEINNPRVFDVEIEGVIALDDYRPSGTAGTDVNVAKVETYQATVTDGILNINFLKGTQNPAVKGFDICFVAPVSDTAPQVTISEPLDVATIGRNVSTTFSGAVTDVEDDDVILTAALTWNSPTEPNFAGTGGTFTDQLIIPGPHTIQASVTDSDDNTVVESITVTVAGPTVDFISPVEGDVLTSTDVQFTWSAENMLLFSPFDEHFHFYVNPDDPDNLNPNDRISTASEIGTLVWDLNSDDGIVEGENTVIIVAAESLHTEFTNPEARDIVTFTVCSTTITNIVSTDPTECGSENGEIVIEATGTNLEYSIDNGAIFQPSNSFTGLSAGNYDIAVREIGTTTCTATDTATLSSPEAPSITEVVSTDPSDCSVENGQIEITATGTDLEYSIDNGASFQVGNIFTGLSAGNYDIVVRELGTTTCTAMDTAALTAPEAPSITEIISTDPTDCGLEDGQIEITALGADLEYSIDNGITFESNNTFNDLAAGIYGLVVREIGTTNCTVIGTATLTAPAIPLITGIVSTNPSDCDSNDGQIVITATGANLEYSIDNGTNFGSENTFTGLAAGPYGIVVRESGTTNCEATDTTTLTAPEAPSITDVVETDPTTCSGSDGQLVINATGSNLEYSIDGGVNFAGSNTFTGLNAGPYDIVVRETGTFGCTATATATLEDPLGTTPIVSGHTTYLEGSGGVTLDAGAGYASYLWSNGETTRTVTVLEGTYSVTTIDTNGCEGTSIGIIVTEEDDSTPPEAVCQSIIVQLGETGNVSITAADIDNGSNDTSGIADLTLNKSTFTCSDLGANQVTLTVTDNNGNVSSCTATVAVEDNIEPIISCPANIDMLSSGSQVLQIIPATATDNCDNPPAVSFVRSDNANLGLNDPFPQGITTIQWTATDDSGNIDICLQTITIALPQSTSNEIVSFMVGGQVGQEVIDSNTGTINLIVAIGTNVGSLSPSIDISNLASIDPVSGAVRDFSNSTAVPIIYTVTAEDGSTKEWAVSVTVQDDTTDPEITCPVNIVVDNDFGECGAVVSFLEPLGTDNLPGVITQQTQGLTSGAIFPIGTTIQAYTATDAAGNSMSCSFTITVNDTEAPAITCPSDSAVSVPAGITSAEVTFPGPSISDNCPGSTLTQTAGLASGSSFPIGTTTNTFQVTDAAGNSASCSFDVTVEAQVTNVLSVTSFTLINADTDQELFTISDGMVIDINSLPTLFLDVRANATADVESVKFVMSGEQQRTGTESVPPYALFQDSPTGNYKGNDFTAGNYTLTGTPYSGNGANGNQGTSLTIGFELVDGDPDCLNVEVAVQTVTDPSGCGRTDGSIVLNVTGTTGNLDYDWGHDANLESATASGLSAGSYSVTVTDANGCTKTVSVELVDPSAPSVSLAPFANIVTTASPITLSGGLPIGGTFSGTGVNANGVFDPSIGVGTYTITYSYTDTTTGCGEGTATRTITVTPVVADSALTVLNANTDTPLYALVDGLKIQKDDIGNTPLGIVYEPITNPSNVKFTLTGPISRNTTEGRAPYSLYGDIGVDIQGRAFPIGAYTLVVKPSNGPATTVNFEVTDIDLICSGFDVAVQSASDPTVCNGTDGSVALAVTGGAAPFSFDWTHDANLESATATGLSAGGYTVEVTDANGCSETLTATLEPSQAPTVTLSAFPSVADDAPAFALSGGSPAGGTYSGTGVDANGFFDPSIGAGTYTITYSYTNPATGCEGSATRTIRVTSTIIDSDLTVLDANTDTPLYALVDGLIIQKNDIGNTPLGIVYEPGTNPRSVKFTLTGPISRSYSEGKAPYSLYGDIGVDIQGRVFPVGQYTLVVNPSNAPAITVNFSVVQGTSNTAKSASRMKMFPNPAIDRTTVSFPEPVKLTQFFVYDITGRLIKTIESEATGDTESVELPVYDLPIGTYFIRTTDMSGKTFQQRLVIEQ